MKTWELTWNSYEVLSTRPAIFFDTFRVVPISERMWILFIFVLFLTAIILFLIVFSQKPTLIEIYSTLFVVMMTEYLILTKVNKIKLKYIDEHLGGTVSRQVPPDNKNQRRARYLKFKSELKKSGIDKSMLDDVFDALRAKEELEKESGVYIKKYFGFVVGLVSGIALSTIRQLDTASLVSVFVILILVSLLVYFAGSLIPSRSERLKELNYFLILYKQDF